MVGHATTRPVRLRVHDTTLACQVARTIGYAARCACGETFPIRKSYDEARQDATVHTEWCRTKSLQVPHTEKGRAE